MNNKKNYALLIFMSIFLIGFVSADTIFVKTNEITPLKIPCTLDGFPCSASAQCNATIKFPNQSYLIDNQAMTNLNNGDFQINVSINKSGVYPGKFFCQDSGQNATITPDINANPSGRGFDEGQGLVSFAILAATLTLAFIFLKVGFKLGENDTLIPIAFFFVVFALILSIYSLHLSYVFTSDILQYESLTPVTSAVYISILWSVIGLFIISMALMLIAFIKELSKISDKHRFGDGFDPLTQTYQF